MCSECHQNPCSPQCPNDSEEPIDYCWDCECDLYYGDDAYEFFGHYYCEDCLERHYVTVEREAI